MSDNTEPDEGAQRIEALLESVRGGLLAGLIVVLTLLLGGLLVLKGVLA